MVKLFLSGEAPASQTCCQQTSAREVAAASFVDRLRFTARLTGAVGSTRGDDEARPAPLHRERRGRRAHRSRAARPPDRLRPRPAGAGPEGVLLAAGAE